MQDVIVVMIWDKDPKNVYSRPIVLDNKTRALKFKGKKANKVIVPESLTDKRLLRTLKNATAHNCQIVKATGR